MAPSETPTVRARSFNLISPTSCINPDVSRTMRDPGKGLRELLCSDSFNRLESVQCNESFTHRRWRQVSGLLSFDSLGVTETNRKILY